MKDVKLLKKDIPSELNEIFNLAVTTGVFPTNLKAVKVIPVHKFIYPLQFGFRKNYSATHALIHLANLISESLDKEKFVCRIFVDLQKALDTVDYEVLLSKLDYYGIQGVTNNCFETYLCNRNQ